MFAISGNGAEVGSPVLNGIAGGVMGFVPGFITGALLGTSRKHFKFNGSLFVYQSRRYEMNRHAYYKD